MKVKKRMLCWTKEFITAYNTFQTIGTSLINEVQNLKVMEDKKLVYIGNG